MLATPAPRVRWAVRDGLLIARRDLTQWFREPQMVLWNLLFPVVSVLLFAFVFGSAMIAPEGGNYQDFLMPGFFAQTMAFGLSETIMAVQADSAKGVTDRFRSMPIAPSAVVLGRCFANMLYSVAGLAIVVLCGLAIGWRWHNGLDGALAAFALLLLLRLAMLWVGIVIGLKARHPEAVSGLIGLMYPVTMLTNAFADPARMPGVVGALAEANPLSWTITAIRGLFGNPVGAPSGWLGDNAVLLATVWPLVLSAVFLPLAVRAFQGLSR
ncbi:ABC transporter permease [Allokutzneria oryzae]|uniref:Transport permease protein n=1 Tax=Allokutzneria oryzae TaxID=1378989 RepID=A0ABV6A6X8_9PSEU